MGASIGRPRLFNSPEEMQQAIDAYFATQDMHEPPKPYTMAGLARALKCSTTTLRNYRDEDWADAALVAAVKSARQRVEEWTEERLYKPGQHPAGVIFSMKNNFGWKDEQSVTVTHEAVYTLRSRQDEALFEPPTLGEGRMLSAGESDSAPIEADLVRVESAERGETT